MIETILNISDKKYFDDIIFGIFFNSVLKLLIILKLIY